MALTNASLPAKRRILAVCVKLFLEQGYKKTTVAEIVQKADVSNSSFQNIFRAKDGVLTELVAFMFDTFGGVLFAKLLNLFLKEKINPMIGAAGISAFPMASRVVHKLGREADDGNWLLMHAAGANVAGQIASVIAGGLIIALVH